MVIVAEKCVVKAQNVIKQGRTDIGSPVTITDIGSPVTITDIGSPVTITKFVFVNPLKPELNPICYLLALLAHHFLHVSRIRVKSLTIRLLMSYIYIWSTYS